MATLCAPKNLAKKSKDTRFFARISTADKELIEEAATIMGQSVASFVLSQARDAANEVLEKQSVIKLNHDESRRLMEALLAPTPPPSPRMRCALNRYRKSVVSNVNF